MSSLENTVTASMSAPLASRIDGVIKQLKGVTPNDQDFERIVRENLAMGESPLASDLGHELQEATLRLLHRTDDASDDLLVCFCAAFEWLNRCEKDAVRRTAGWDALMRAAGKRFEGVSVYHYMRSRYLLGKGRRDEALKSASAAVDLAPMHSGYLNNYGELMLAQVEDRLLAGDLGVLTQENSRGEDIEQVICRFDDRIASPEKTYPSFYLTRGRLCACVKRFDEAEANFNAARSLIVKMREDGEGRFANESDYIIEIGKVITAQTTSSVLKSSYTAWESLEAARLDQERRAEELSEKMDEVYARLDEERINLLEFLGFFSGIISFVIASIQVGSDMDFTARAALLVVMLGTLLIAFGALGYLIESGRTQSAAIAGKKRVSSLISAKSRVLLVTGICCTAFGFIIYFALKLAGL